MDLLDTDVHPVGACGIHALPLLGRKQEKNGIIGKVLWGLGLGVARQAPTTDGVQHEVKEPSTPAQHDGSAER